MSQLETQSVQLWTWHSPEFDLTTGDVDHSLSAYVINTPGVREAYDELFQRLGTYRIVWCLIREEDSRQWQKNQKINQDAEKRLVWNLDVPNNEILEIIDTFVWNRIIEECSGSVIRPENRAYPKWVSQNCRDQFPSEPGKWDLCVEMARREYDNRPCDGWWSRLFLGSRLKSLNESELLICPNTEEAAALIRHPVRKEWVIRRPD